MANRFFFVAVGGAFFGELKAAFGVFGGVGRNG